MSDPVDPHAQTEDARARSDAETPEASVFSEAPVTFDEQPEAAPVADAATAPGAPDVPTPAAADDAGATPLDAAGARDAGWNPAEAPAPSPEEDEALRAERARRFGADREGAPAPTGPVAEEHGTTQGPGSDDTRAIPAGHGEANTAELSANAEALLAEDEAGDAPTHPVTPLPASPASGVGAIGAVPATRAMPSTPVTRVTSPAQDEDDDPFAGFNEGPESRAAAHWWVVLVSLVFVPVAWYLLADGGERLAWSIEHGDTVNVWAYVELGGGLIAAIIVLLAARWSSVGPIVFGSITALIGGAYLAVPDRAQEFLADYAEIFTRLGQFGQNVLDHLQRDAVTGRLLTYGIFLIMAGVISHGARRQGRREERVRLELDG